MNSVEKIIQSLTPAEQRIFREVLALEKQSLADAELEKNENKYDSIVNTIVACINRGIVNEN